jgi:hypothetical protein
MAAGVCGFARTARGEAAEGPQFSDVYATLRAHLAGVSEAELNRAAVEGLIAALGPKAFLVTNGIAASDTNAKPVTVSSSILESNIAYVRVEKVAPGLSKAVRDAYAQLAASNKLKGVVLDLRYAGGRDYAAAVDTADLFVKADRPLLDWGKGPVHSKEKSDAIALPVAVLVNSRTVGAAEALAAVLRNTGAGLVLGGRTAGQAFMTDEFSLKNGDKLLIATGLLHLGDGSEMAAQGVQPDITVEVSVEDERAYFADAYRASGRVDLTSGMGLLSTNQAAASARPLRRPRFNEAELVRERREGLSEADLINARDREAERPLISDPVLARAVDLLKGLALVRGARS